jgi:ubiquinone/menaquinone biosynthesis C-methylase UbiE
MADVNCCSSDAQATCCESAAKDACCGTAAAGGSCGCAEGNGTDIRETVRDRYAAAARAAAGPATAVVVTDADEHGVFGASLYDEEADAAPARAVNASLGCGVPTAVADLHAGETVLDLGSGAGADVLISARRVGPTGRAIGLDMTDEMLALAQRNAAEADAANVQFLKGHIEDIPLPDGAVDVVISNCVINLSGDKPQVLREAARVLRPGGRFAVSDVVADDDMDEATRADMAAWTGCIAGALTRGEYERYLRAAGFADVEIRETHRVHEHAGAAIIRATKPPLACALDGDGAAEQLARYAALREHAAVVRREVASLTVALGPAVDLELVGATVAVERECCPFLAIDWDEAGRELTITAPAGAEPVLDRIALALAA